MYMMNPTKESVSSALLSPNFVANLLKISSRFPKILFIFLTLITIRGTQREKIGKRLGMQFSAFSYPFMAF